MCVALRGHAQVLPPPPLAGIGNWRGLQSFAPHFALGRFANALLHICKKKKQRVARCHSCVWQAVHEASFAAS